MSDFNEEQRKENWNQIEIQVLLKEYEVLRAEILQLMQNSSNTLNYGITGLAAVWTAGALIVSSKTLSGDTLSPPQLKMLSFLVALVAPSVIAFSCRLWLLDTKSVIRIGKYIQWLEDKIQDLSGKKLLEWERCLHRKNYEPYQLQKETENQFKLKKWKEDYFQSFSFFRSHLFTVLYLYVITVAIALFVLLKYASDVLNKEIWFSLNGLPMNLKWIYISIILLNTCILAPSFLELWIFFREDGKLKNCLKILLNLLTFSFRKKN